MKRSLCAAIVLAAISVSTAAAKPAPPVGGPVAPPNAHAYGRSLADWCITSAEWTYATGQNLGYPVEFPYQPGPAPIVFIPIPSGEQVSGSWTPEDPAVLVGSVHITLPAGTGFFTPLWTWTAERYEGHPDVPDDPTIPEDQVRNAILGPDGPGTVPILTMDGQPMLRDFWAQYIPATQYDPPIPYLEPTGYGSVAAVAFQGCAMVVNPLPVGRHVMHLVERVWLTDAQIPGYNLGLVWDNTWVIDVVPPGKAK